MTALGRLHMVAAGKAVEVRDSQAGARTNDADRASLRERNVGAGKMRELAGRAIRQVRDEPDEERASLLRSIIDRSVTGVAAGLQNTG